MGSVGILPDVFGILPNTLFFSITPALAWKRQIPDFQAAIQDDPATACGLRPQTCTTAALPVCAQPSSTSRSIS